ncbi:MAG TPA: proline--tRNA ligase [Candidatus Woesebacteria bacterium]|nr:proline--tRNA ligase [Candidatus Woesebacteria bacterium]
MAKSQLKDFNTNLSEWYNDVVLKSELADYAPVKGCMVIRPYGYALWEGIQKFMDTKIKEKGVQNAYFPLFIPMHYLEKEKEHVAGFSPELAVVTIGGGEELTEKLAVRPTSETIMYDMYKKWTSSWRDLPVMMNQWCNIVRWEKRTYLFLRTSEFLWQEGHCAHLTQKENLDMLHWALDMYEQTYNELLGMYGIKGRKSQSEKFPGAGDTFTFESLMPNGKALQACTSHDLGQNFSKSFDWTVQDQNKEKTYPWQNSWGLSTRAIGGLIMAHGDENGLKLPPNIAPIQIIIIPIPGHVTAAAKANEIYLSLKSNFRVKIDNIDGETAGFKFNQWELKGVPLRLEIGDRDVAANSVILTRRDTGEKITSSISNLESTISNLLVKIQNNLFNIHKKFTEDHTFSVDSYDEFKKIMESSRGFIKAHWCENPDCETEIKKDTKATTRCLPLDAPEEEGKCVRCGKPSHHRWIFGLSY